jgi:hypothetical protein
MEPKLEQIKNPEQKTDVEKALELMGENDKEILLKEFDLKGLEKICTVCAKTSGSKGDHMYALSIALQNPDPSSFSWIRDQILHKELEQRMVDPEDKDERKEAETHAYWLAQWAWQYFNNHNISGKHISE